MMTPNPGLTSLQPYPFEKLAQLLSGITPAASEIALTIGEPQHAPPEHVLQCLQDNLHLISKYPATKGLPELRSTIAAWLQQRFHTKVDADTQILPVNGTREALFAVAQCLVSGSPSSGSSSDPSSSQVVMPNPGYQIYEGAALLAGAQPYFLDNRNDLIPDYAAVPAEVWQKTGLLYVCSPGNPTGKVMSLEDWQLVLELADQYDFVIAADECYSELYPDENNPPLGLLEACARLGRDDYARCLIFHSLSKRSNLPGLRSGFVAGDAQLIAQFFRYRTYHGCAMSLVNQHASIAAWQDEQHVQHNRIAYREKFAAVLAILGDFAEPPDASFYLWPHLPSTLFNGDDELFAKQLYMETGVKLLPGRYLGDHGKGRVRLSLVPELSVCITAAERLRDFIADHQA